MAVPTLTDVKSQLKITTGDQDELLNAYLKAALRLIEARVGPSSVRAFTEQITSRGGGLNLSHRPITAITTITSLRDGYVAPAVADLEFDARAGTVWMRDNTTLVGSWEVTYSAGWATWPENYYLATLVTVQHLWKTTRGGGRRPNQGSGDELNITFASSVSRTIRSNSIQLPAAAMELIGDSLFYGGIA
jgi:uncharacterized phiE125 gp8 family phage protein